MVMGKFRESVIEPEVPVIVTLDCAEGADAAAEKVTSCGVPGVTVGLEGETVTPVGRPLNWMLICEVKPLVPEAERDAISEPPAGSEILAGLMDKVNSGLGGGGLTGGGELAELPPPQAIKLKGRTKTSRRHNAGRQVCEANDNLSNLGSIIATSSFSAQRIIPLD
jgi:hypothetical protein